MSQLFKRKNPPAWPAVGVSLAIHNFITLRGWCMKFGLYVFALLKGQGYFHLPNERVVITGMHMIQGSSHEMSLKAKRDC
jgi:hypothetical protein